MQIKNSQSGSLKLNSLSCFFFMFNLHIIIYFLFLLVSSVHSQSADSLSAVSTYIHSKKYIQGKMNTENTIIPSIKSSINPTSRNLFKWFFL